MMFTGDTKTCVLTQKLLKGIITYKLMGGTDKEKERPRSVQVGCPIMIAKTTMLQVAKRLLEKILPSQVKEFHRGITNSIK